MKTILITCDDLGRSVLGYAHCAQSFEFCDFNGSTDSLLDRLNTLGINHGSSGARRVNLIADADSPNAWVEDLLTGLQEKIDPKSLYIYFVGRGGSISLGSPHYKKAYSIGKYEEPGNFGQIASYVMMVHEVPEVKLFADQISPGALVMAHAWPLVTLTPGTLRGVRVEEGARRRMLEEVLPEGFRAVDLLIEDLRRRLLAVLEILPTFDRWEERTYRALVAPIERLIKNLADESTGLALDTLLECLPHSLDVQVRLALLFREIRDPNDRARLADTAVEVIREVHEESQQITWEPPDRPLEILSGIVPIRLEDRDRPAVFREKVEGNCRHLLRTLESSLVRRRMLESLVCLALRKPLDEQEDLESVREELRLYLQHVRGGGVFLILPKNSAGGERKDLRDWVERVMGIPCRIVITHGNEAWLYVESPCEFRSDAQILPCHAPQLSAEPTPSPPSLVSCAEPSPAIMQGRCPDCGAPVAESPMPFLPPGEEGVDLKQGSRPPKRCRTCGCLNSKDWWVCWNHGKAPILVAIDKARCPECILSHHENPEGFPLSRISVNPHYREPLLCPNCVSLRRCDPGHPIFEIPRELEKYYRDGVNGHDSVPFREIVRRVGLFGDCYCPSCGTILIPVHHKAGSSLPS